MNMAIIKERKDGWGFKNSAGNWTGRYPTEEFARKKLLNWKPTATQLYVLGKIANGDTLKIHGSNWSQQVVVYGITGKSLLVNMGSHKRVPIVDAFKIMRGGTCGKYSMRQVLHVSTGKTFAQLREECAMTETQQPDNIRPTLPIGRIAPDVLENMTVSDINNYVSAVEESIVRSASSAAQAALDMLSEDEKNDFEFCRSVAAESVISVFERFKSSQKVLDNSNNFNYNEVQ
jgi:hypothetical protein